MSFALPRNPIALLLLLLLATGQLYGAVRINELQASNTNTISDPDFNDYADWIELYNAGTETADLGGLYLTDDLSEPLKWNIPDGTSIPANGYLLIWADDQNSGLHTNFKLSADGEQLGLFASDGTPIDTLSYPPQTANHSYGRIPDGSSSWFSIQFPTPGYTNTDQAQTRAPIFSQAAGFYANGLILGMTPDQVDTYIYYTLDGSEPDQNSQYYQSPLTIDQTTVVRARAYGTGLVPSRIVTATYFVETATELPVISLSTNPANFWDDEIGIYVEGSNGISGYCVNSPRNWNQDWERPVHLEFFKAGGEFWHETNAGVKIGGGCTRKYDQKSLSVHFRGEYGYPRLDLRLFEDLTFTSYNNFMLRNNGQDWYRALFRDGLIHTLVKDRMNVDWQAYQPAILFLNGEYWGLHSFREKHNEHYLANRYGFDPDEIDILSGNADIKQGSDQSYLDLLNFIRTNDPDNAGNYAQICARMDMDNYLDYVITEIYTANTDWPGGNIKFWRPQITGGKWRWILYDTDMSLGATSRGEFDSNTLQNASSPTETYYANPVWSTELLRRLLGSTAFRQAFVQRFAGHLNTTFAPDRVLSIADSLSANIAPEIPHHISKWPASTSFNDGWSYHVAVIKEFAENRPDYMRQHLQQKFSLSGMAQLNVQIADLNTGSVELSGVAISADNFTGSFFKDIPIECVAQARRGYRFLRWEGPVEDSLSARTSITLENDASIKAIFEPDTDEPLRALRINEFMALNQETIQNGSGEYEDWLELYNAGKLPLDLSGIYLTDDLSNPTLWQLPPEPLAPIILNPGEFILLWADDDTKAGYQHLGFRLNAAGESIGIACETDTGITFLDTLHYGSQFVDESFGRGEDGRPGFRYFQKPTPGSSNTEGWNPPEIISITEVSLRQNYPNPFNTMTTIRYSLPDTRSSTFSIYDLRGRFVREFYWGPRWAGEHQLTWNGLDEYQQAVSAGLYIGVLRTGTEQKAIKMLFTK
ncbi:MAG: CotH kinase family protein [Candidatus Marinimicrobia bacterium]|nr:CotH kinase family protein [Candidatus Neomarinimicrobiota bacterium]MCF7851347.1 CotH kinase family protein [Candidatus Neomarinimicrobiota bacterium]MCF7905059.1 CotH kinase family protein [Candidatus Neomarinimicrobiota bacterium]